LARRARDTGSSAAAAYAYRDTDGGLPGHWTRDPHAWVLRLPFHSAMRVAAPELQRRTLRHGPVARRPDDLLCAWGVSHGCTRGAAALMPVAAAAACAATAASPPILQRRPLPAMPTTAVAAAGGRRGHRRSVRGEGAPTPPEPRCATTAAACGGRRPFGHRCGRHRPLSAIGRCRRSRGAPPLGGTRRQTAGPPQSERDATAGIRARRRLLAGWGRRPAPLRGNSCLIFCCWSPTLRGRASSAGAHAPAVGGGCTRGVGGRARLPPSSMKRRRWRRSPARGAHHGPTGRLIGRSGSATGVRSTRGSRVVSGATDARRGAPVRSPRAGAPSMERAHRHGPAAAAPSLHLGRSSPQRNVPLRGRQGCRLPTHVLQQWIALALWTALLACPPFFRGGRPRAMRRQNRQ